jgi:chromosome segregation and condensation protein ScpB
VAALSTVQLITALLEASPGLEALGLQIRLTNGTAQMFTGRIQNEMLSAFIAERVPASSGAGELTQAALEVLSCIAFKQPVSQGEIDQIFGDTDKRHLVSVLRQLELVEEFAGPDGRLRFATTGKFLDRFGLSSIDDLHGHSF